MLQMDSQRNMVKKKMGNNVKLRAFFFPQSEGSTTILFWVNNVEFATRARVFELYYTKTKQEKEKIFFLASKSKTT